MSALLTKRQDRAAAQYVVKGQKRPFETLIRLYISVAPEEPVQTIYL